MILLAPLLVAITVIALVKDFKTTKYLAVTASVASLALFPFVSNGTSAIGWFSVSGHVIDLTVSITPLSSILILIVLIIAPLIYVYSFGFMTLPSEQRRYYIEMLAFETAMLAFAMSGNFIMLFMAWEFLSLTSYLLIGFWYNRDKAARAARKTITIILIGDLALLGSIVIFQNAFGTLEFGGIINGIGSHGVPPLATVLLLVAIMTKSAQFPFHEWLADAMEGPAPVSAFLHSSTMVKAGVFAAIVLFPIFSAAKDLGLLLVVGIVTAIFGLLNAMREQHVKRVLAYSTVEELGLMLAAVGSGALLASIYFFFAQSFYKALLFFSAGAAMSSTEKEALNEITGLKQNRMMYAATLFGVLALAGFVPFDGFFANAGLGSAFSTNLIVYILLAFINLGTSFYIFRWFELQDRKVANQRTRLNLDTIPKSMLYPMIVLAACTLAASGGFFFFPGLLPNLGGTNVGLSISIPDALIEIVVVAAGAYVAYSLYRQKNRVHVEAPLSSAASLAYTAIFVNLAYNHMAEFIETLADAVAYVDASLNELFDRAGRFTVRMGSVARHFSVGEINFYAMILAGGLLLLIVVAVAL